MTRSAMPSGRPVEDAMRYAFAIGATLVLLVPEARGHAAVGWLPLWLLGMPLAAWACLRLAALRDHAPDQAAAPGRSAAPRARPVASTAARRRSRVAAHRRRPRAA